MIPGFNSALSGLRANTDRMRVAANNTANINTIGFKKSEAVSREGAGGRGTVSTIVRQVTSPGPSYFTGNPQDVALVGSGFFRVNTPDGGTAFTRRGAFTTDKEGRLGDSNGNLLKPEIKIPANASSVSIAGDGRVEGIVDGQKKVFGQIEVVKFNNPSGLTSIGGGFFAESSSSGAPITGIPGQSGVETLLTGSLEGSNVDITEEIVDTILAKHGYKANLKMLEAADELLGSTLNIKL